LPFPGRRTPAGDLVFPFSPSDSAEGEVVELSVTWCVALSRRSCSPSAWGVSDAHLHELADVLRSRSAGPFQATIDVMFGDAARHARALVSELLTPRRITTPHHHAPSAGLEIPSGLSAWRP